MEIQSVKWSGSTNRSSTIMLWKLFTVCLPVYFTNIKYASKKINRTTLHGWELEIYFESRQGTTGKNMGKPYIIMILWICILIKASFHLNLLSWSTFLLWLLVLVLLSTITSLLLKNCKANNGILFSLWCCFKNK